MGGWRRRARMGIQPIRGDIYSLIPRGHSGSQRRIHSSELSLPRGKRAGVFIHRLHQPLVKGYSWGEWGLLIQACHVGGKMPLEASPQAIRGRCWQLEAGLVCSGGKVRHKY